MDGLYQIQKGRREHATEHTPHGATTFQTPRGWVRAAGWLPTASPGAALDFAERRTVREIRPGLLLSRLTLTSARRTPGASKGLGASAASWSERGCEPRLPVPARGGIAHDNSRRDALVDLPVACGYRSPTRAAAQDRPVWVPRARYS